jgi:hypothetical protein
MLTVEVIEAEEFGDLSRKYNVSGVPKSVINDTVEFVGAAPEDFVVAKILSVNTP